MQIANRFIATLFLTAALGAPVAIAAAPAPQARVQVRVYDRNHKDYHNWDDHENQSWGAYLSENHKKSHEFTKANRKEQSEYWNYRHSHPDRDDRR
jgi:hypothetical protein